MAALISNTLPKCTKNINLKVNNTAAININTQEYTDSFNDISRNTTNTKPL
jgi:hypothetical protein